MHPEDSISTADQNGAKTSVDHALAGWKRCDLTPSQTHTELVRYTKNLERQRDELAEALRDMLEHDRLTYEMSGKIRLRVPEAVEKARALLAKLK